MTRVLPLLVLASLALAGCIQLPDDASGVEGAATSSGEGTMTAKEERRDASELCRSLTLETDQRFCATRVVTVSGALAGFALLDVGLDTFNGEVEIAGGPEGAWSLVATLEARGATAEAATAAIDAIDFRWAHEEGGRHFVEAIAEHEGSNEHGEAVALVLTVPRSQLLRVLADTSNGDVTVKDVRTDGLAADTSNGRIAVDADVTQVALDTSNGDIDAALRPLSGGSWTLDTSNGNVALKVPEGAAYGYDMHGSTSNGEVDYTLRDGAEGPCPEGSEYYTPPCDERSFTTTRFSARDRQVTVTLDTSNGDVTVAST